MFARSNTLFHLGFLTVVKISRKYLPIVLISYLKKINGLDQQSRAQNTEKIGTNIFYVPLNMLFIVFWETLGPSLPNMRLIYFMQVDSLENSSLFKINCN